MNEPGNIKERVLTPTETHKASEGGMTRGQQTAWIVGTIVVIALLALAIWANQPDANERDPECYNFLGFEDADCKYEKARARLSGRFY